jgi:FkbM family methyltransferase
MLDITRAYSLTFMVAQNDPVIGRILRDHGEFARIESALIIDYIRHVGGDGAYLDIGANIGTIALPVAAACPKTSVVAVEAQRAVAAILATNAMVNHLYNVDVIHAAAGPAPGLMPFPQARLGARETNFGVIGAHLDTLPTENVRVCTLDEIAPENTCFVKIDVEGFEPEVLKGAERLIRETRPVWLLESNPKTMEPARSTMQTLFAAGYRLFWFYVPFVSPASKKLPRIPANHRGDMNFLALPPNVENLWNLIEFSSPDAEPPSRASDFRYLEKVGFKLPARAVDGPSKEGA